MKRFKYGLNSQVFQTAQFYALNCVGITEVVPGDTIGGKTTARIISESCLAAYQNCAYNDLYAFYVPYRLVWEEWPEWIAGNTDTPIPLVGGNTGGIYQQCLAEPTTDTQSANSFGKRSYNLIWNKFFRDQGS